MLVLIDESGHPHPNDNTTRPVLLAVCIKESDLGRIIRSLFSLRRRLLGQIKLTAAEEEGKAVEFLNRRSLTKSSAKREYADSLFEMVRDFDLTVFAIVMERPTKAPYRGPDFLQIHHRRLLDRIELFMEQRHPNHMALPIFDGQDPISNKRFADCFTGFMVKTPTGMAKQHIVPTPLFVDSRLTQGIQIADAFAYVTRIDHENRLFQTTPSDPYLSAIKRYSVIVKQKTIDFTVGEEGFVWYGIATMDASRFVYDRPDVAAIEAPEDLPVPSEDLPPPANA